MSDWRELPAGRELDRVIAERLGFTISTYNPFTYPLSGDYEIVGSDGHRHHLPAYSTSVDAALTLEVIDKESSSGKSRAYLQPTVNEWTATYYRGETLHYRRDFHGSAATPALAICRAWLAWREAEGK